ncbi:PIN domain-like protein [Anaeromyces robustus]|uniref:PIN domain-like protein n=1 Tax=Anaeromyces robustus TaxID=1754192 RepID=A0A1Y1X4I0_9FUNG|nr:PIN domain-like protein [Anaeromyces robustus]|eukprot:ORX80719.1 PIN domain-like protein [Anaeromyces robustus]
MGVKKLNTLVNQNLNISTQTWTINQNEYKYLTSYKRSNKNVIKKKNEISEKASMKTNKLSKDNNSLKLIVDANAFFYYLGYKLNWFNFDMLNFFNILQKYLHQLLAIDNLEKLIFVFDGMDTNMKMGTILSRFEDRIKGIKEFYDRIITSSKPSKYRYFVPKKIFPTPLVRIAYSQYLIDAAKHYKKLEVKFSLLEADATIANLAIKINAYVISKDSDFYIYNVPGYINLESLKFPKKDSKLSIKYTLYNNNYLVEYLGIPRETLPIFATLCGNDYLSINKYRKFSNQLSNYECHHQNKNNINEYQKCIINFILDLYDTINKRNDIKINPKKKLKLMIDELLNIKEKENNSLLEKECQNKIIDSIKEYNLTALNENKTSHISKDILKSHSSGKIYEIILNVLYSNHYKCTQYFENLQKENCWYVADDVRKETYKLLLIRNYSKKNSNSKKSKNQNIEKNDNNYSSNNDNNIKQNNNDDDNDNTKQNFTINEFIRKENSIIKNTVDIIIDINKPLPESIESRFCIYLTTYKSNILPIKKLPYYLIPITSCLRYYLINKIKCNAFIYDKDNGKEKNKKNIYSNIVNNNSKNHKKNNKSHSNITILHDYEFETLLASCVAALTLTYLHKRVYNKITNATINNKKKDKNNQKNNQKKAFNLSIKNNIKKNNIGCHNIYDNIKYHKNRSLFLKEHWCIQDIHDHKIEFENAVQIYAEFLSLLITNSQTMQVLNLGHDLPEMITLYSMYHYLWKDAFYSMIKKKHLFKYPKDKKIYYIFFVFKSLFKFNEKNSETEKYLTYLEEIYSEMINSILS